MAEGLGEAEAPEAEPWLEADHHYSLERLVGTNCLAKGGHGGRASVG
jgi:hypothetical protein